MTIESLSVQRMRSENDSSGSNHYGSLRSKRCPSGSLRSLHLWRMPEMVAPIALVFRPLVKGNEDSENEIVGTKESVYIRKALKSHRISLVQQHGRRFIVLEH